MSKHPQFEAVKVALKQDKTGYVLTLNIHPDDLDERILRDYVGARYQVVMVRLDGQEQPMDRQDEFVGDEFIKLAGKLCRDKFFWDFLMELGNITEPKEQHATEWLRTTLGIKTRAELKTNPPARVKLDAINWEFRTWLTKN